MFDEPLDDVDPDVADAITSEVERQEEGIELIASENFVSRAVLEAAGSVMTNKYAEGYPEQRYYGGCENMDTVEQLAIDRACELFDCDFANVQPHSGSGANMATYMSLIEPGDTIMSLDLTNGGHLSHGAPVNFSGELYDIAHYKVNEESEVLEPDDLWETANEAEPDIVLAGYSAYPREIPFDVFAEIAEEHDAYFVVDIAHIAGLVAKDEHPNPFPQADVVTTTTHKTLRGARGGMIMTNDEEIAETIDKKIFPGIQGGPLMHIIAAKAVAFKEALQPEFKEYQAQIKKNAETLGEALDERGYHIVSGGTDTHLILVDLTPKDLTGKEAEEALDEVNITTNKNTVPGETRSPFVTSGVRLGTPAVTTRGMEEDAMVEIAELIDRVLSNLGSEDVKDEVRQRVKDFTSDYPLYPFIREKGLAAHNL